MRYRFFAPIIWLVVFYTNAAAQGVTKTEIILG